MRDWTKKGPRLARPEFREETPKTGIQQTMKVTEVTFAAPQEWCTCEGNSRGKKAHSFTDLTLLHVVDLVWLFCNAQESCEAGLQRTQRYRHGCCAHLGKLLKGLAEAGGRIGEKVRRGDDDAR